MIIAEISANHNQDLEHALQLIETAQRIGADAVKFQTYKAESITIDSTNDEFMIKHGPWKGRSLYDLYLDAQTPWEWFPQLFKAARARGLIPFSSPFDHEAVDMLEEIDCPIYKVASFELTDLPLIKRIAQTRKPMIMSTGMATDMEIAQALSAARGAKSITLLHCISDYPTRYEDANLQRINDLKALFGVPVGLSDHSLGGAMAVAATAVGATVIEKHLTLARSDGGPDAAFSSEPIEFRDMVRAVRATRAAMKRPEIIPTPYRGLRRSIYVVEDIKSGEKITSKNVRSIRPGNGLAPYMMPNIIGKRAKHKLPKGTPMKLEYVG